MTMPRRQLVDVAVTRYYHCISRCVRRAFLCGEGVTHRKAWIEARLELLAKHFGKKRSQPPNLEKLADCPFLVAGTFSSVAVTAGDKIESLRQWASGRCLSADRVGVSSRSEGVSGGRVRRVVREPGEN